ncbi:AT-hook motif nuclear-localized protein 10-like [Curcuma longa]|uniref:AT-hook motif nuclear-localized protein 10-like n=1 Tax=Curcuma longa TaxID=136217 RepID=UPI003D9E322C
MEVRSEPGIVPFGSGVQKSPVQNQSPMQSMRLVYSQDGTALYKPITTTTNTSPAPASSPVPVPPSVPAASTYEGGGGGGGGSGSIELPSSGLPAQGLNINTGESLKRKRGRPRKYAPDGTMALALTPSPTGASVKRRPYNSKKKQQLAALGSAGIGFTPHVITVKAGEDVSSKIMSFSQHGPRAVCILSANGAISNVTLRQAATSGGTVTYEGRFEILSLSGSFLLTENGGQRSRTGGLSVSLSGPDGRVLGGGVAGMLTAASPVQVVVGSFIADGKKEQKQSVPGEPMSAPEKLTPVGGMMAHSSPSRGTLSESSGGPGSPFNHSTGTCNNGNQQGLPNIPWK